MIFAVYDVSIKYIGKMRQIQEDRRSERRVMDEIAVLIPCYNECKSIAKVVQDVKKVLPDAVIYVYDNNSTDGTDEIARKAGAIVRYERQQGKGNVIRSMFRDIDAKCYIMLDGDDTYPAEFAPEMCRKVLEEGTDMVVGDRLSSTYFTENKRPFHNFGNTIVRAFINHLFHSDIKDIMTGYRAMSYRFVKTFPVLSRNFEIETEMTIHAIDKKMQVDNVIVEYRDRQEGSESKLNTYSDGAKVLKTIFRMYKDYKPLQFFSTIAAVLFILGIAFFIPILMKYIEVGTVTKIPSLVVVCFVILTAIICWFSGIILSTLVHQHKQSFEFELNTVSDRFRELCDKEK